MFNSLWSEKARRQRVRVFVLRAAESLSFCAAGGRGVKFLGPARQRARVLSPYLALLDYVEPLCHHLGVGPFWLIKKRGRRREEPKTSPSAAKRYPLGPFSEERPNMADKCRWQPLAAEGFYFSVAWARSRRRVQFPRIRTAKGFEFSAACGPKRAEGLRCST